MAPLAVTGGDVAYWGLAAFLVLLGLGALYLCLRLGRLFDRISSFISGTERDLLPVVVKTGGTVDRINYQLDKADAVTDSAVSMAESADTAVRAVSTAIARPVEKLSGLAAGVAHGVSKLRRTRSFSEAMETAREAAHRREADLAEDIRGAGGTEASVPRPAPTPPPPAQPRPDPVVRPLVQPRPRPWDEGAPDDGDTAA